MASHWVACGYWSFTALDGFGTADNDWLPDPLYQNKSLSVQYWRAQYFAISQLVCVLSLVVSLPLSLSLIAPLRFDPLPLYLTNLPSCYSACTSHQQ